MFNLSVAKKCVQRAFLLLSSVATFSENGGLVSPSSEAAGWRLSGAIGGPRRHFRILCDALSVDSSSSSSNFFFSVLSEDMLAAEKFSNILPSGFSDHAANSAAKGDLRGFSSASEWAKHFGALGNLPERHGGLKWKNLQGITEHAEGLY